jgi:peroxiredoxin Q/BCP
MTTLQIGDTAPNFKSLDEAGNAVSLADYKGKNSCCFSIPKPALLDAPLKPVI